MEDGDETNRLNFIPCLTWVKRGVAKASPDKVKLSEDELKELLNKTAEGNPSEKEADSSSSDDEELPEPNSTVKSIAENVEPTNDEDDDVIRKYGFDKYDSEEVEPTAVGDFAGLTVFSSNKDDPYITIPDDSDNDSEKEDEIIKPSDNLILVGRVDGDQASLEVYIHNEEEESLYVHHELYLPDLPFCLEWLNYDPSSPSESNLCAIGGMNPVIHVMDIDIVDCLEPAYSLGSFESNSSNNPFAVHFEKKSKKGKKKRAHVGHRDAVLDLSWNTNYTHILASGSVDQTVILWDLETGSVDTTLDAFREKVQTINWHPFEGQTLLSGSCDMAVRVFDCRSKDSYKAWKLPGEVERAIWDHYKPFCFLASTDQGGVHYVDCRNDKPIWELSAHTKEVTGLALSSSCPGLLFTGSNDGIIKVWDIENSSQPVHVWDTNPKLGNLHCLASSPNSPFTIASGGDKKSPNLGVWDLIDNSAVRARFGQRPLLIPKKEEESLKDKPHGSQNTVMESVASAMDDLCLSLQENASKPSRLRLPPSAKSIKKINRGKKKNLKKKNTTPDV